MAEEERDGAQLHTGLARGERRRRLGKRGGGRGVQQTAGPRHRRREDPTAAAQTPQSFLSPAPGTASHLRRTQFTRAINRQEASNYTDTQ